MSFEEIKKVIKDLDDLGNISSLEIMDFRKLNSFISLLRDEVRPLEFLMKKFKERTMIDPMMFITLQTLKHEYEDDLEKLKDLHDPKKRLHRHIQIKAEIKTVDHLLKMGKVKSVPRLQELLKAKETYLMLTRGHPTTVAHRDWKGHEPWECYDLEIEIRLLKWILGV